MDTKPYEVGDRIEHWLMPGFWMTVLETAECETPDHLKYKIIDFTGTEDWLCANDVRRDPGEVALASLAFEAAGRGVNIEDVR